MVQRVFLDPPEIFLFPLKDTEMLISLSRNRLAGKLLEEEFYFSGWFFRKNKATSTQGWPRSPWMLGKSRVWSCSATLQPCLEVTQGEGSWSVTPTCSTSINLLVKHQGSFTSVMAFYFITQHAVHEAAFPQCINLVREKTPSSPSLCHQLPFWDRRAFGNASTA